MKALIPNRVYISSSITLWLIGIIMHLNSFYRSKKRLLLLFIFLLLCVLLASCSAKQRKTHPKQVCKELIGAKIRYIIADREQIIQNDKIPDLEKFYLLDQLVRETINIIDSAKTCYDIGRISKNDYILALKVFRNTMKAWYITPGAFPDVTSATLALDDISLWQGPDKAGYARIVGNHEHWANKYIWSEEEYRRLRRRWHDIDTELNLNKFPEAHMRVDALSGTMKKMLEEFAYYGPTCRNRTKKQIGKEIENEKAELEKKESKQVVDWKQKKKIRLKAVRQQKARFVELTKRLREALENEASIWTKNGDRLADAFITPNNGNNGKSKLTLEKRIHRVSTNMKLLCDNWNLQPLKLMRKNIGFGFYKYLKLLHDHFTADADTYKFKIIVSREKPPTDDEYTGMQEPEGGLDSFHQDKFYQHHKTTLGELITEITRHDSMNLRVYFEFRDAEQAWAEHLPSGKQIDTSIIKSDVGKMPYDLDDSIQSAAEMLLKAYYHTESPRMRAELVANLVNNVTFPITPAGEFSEKLSNNPDLVRARIAGRRFAELALCLMNKAILVDKDNTESCSFPPPNKENASCVSLPIQLEFNDGKKNRVCRNKGVNVSSSVQKAYRKVILGVLANYYLQEDHKGAETGKKLFGQAASDKAPESVLCDLSKIASQPNFDHMAMDLLTYSHIVNNISFGNIKMPHSQAGPLLAKAILMAKNQLDRVDDQVFIELVQGVDPHVSRFHSLQSSMEVIKENYFKMTDDQKALFEKYERIYCDTASMGFDVYYLSTVKSKNSFRDVALYKNSKDYFYPVLTDNQFHAYGNEFKFANKICDMDVSTGPYSTGSEIISDSDSSTDVSSTSGDMAVDSADIADDTASSDVDSTDDSPFPEGFFAPDDTTAPEVSIIYPKMDKKVQQGDKVVVEAVATDNEKISEVEFFVNNELIGSDNSPPYEADWDTNTKIAGEIYSIHSIAYDTVGNSSDSKIIKILILPKKAEVDQGCPFNGKFIKVGDPKPGNECQICNKVDGVPKWITRPDGYKCKDGNKCNGNDFCRDGECKDHDWNDPCKKEGKKCDEGKQMCVKNNYPSIVAGATISKEELTEMGIREVFGIFDNIRVLKRVELSEDSIEITYIGLDIDEYPWAQSTNKINKDMLLTYNGKSQEEQDWSYKKREAKRKKWCEDLQELLLKYYRSDIDDDNMIAVAVKNVRIIEKEKDGTIITDLDHRICRLASGTVKPYFIDIEDTPYDDDEYTFIYFYKVKLDPVQP